MPKIFYYNYKSIIQRGSLRRRLNYLDNLIKLLLFKIVKFLSHSLVAEDDIRNGQNMKQINVEN